MAMTLLAASQQAAQSDFIDRIQLLLVKAAIAMINEDPATANHASRINLANRIKQSPEGLVSRWAYFVVASLDLSTINSLSEISDSSLQVDVNSLIGVFL